MQADRLTKALRKGNGSAEPFADDQGELQLGGRFVWKKKIERELQDGARTKDIYERERMNTDAERQVGKTCNIFSNWTSIFAASVLFCKEAVLMAASLSY